MFFHVPKDNITMFHRKVSSWYNMQEICYKYVYNVLSDILVLVTLGPMDLVLLGNWSQCYIFNECKYLCMTRIYQLFEFLKNRDTKLRDELITTENAYMTDLYQVFNDMNLQWRLKVDYNKNYHFGFRCGNYFCTKRISAFFYIFYYILSTFSEPPR